MPYDNCVSSSFGQETYLRADSAQAELKLESKCEESEYNTLDIPDRWVPIGKTARNRDVEQKSPSCV